MSFQNYLAKYKDTHPIFMMSSVLVLLLSFLRGVIAISIGALLDVLGEVMLAVLLISPAILAYGFYRLRSYLRYTLLIMAGIWLLSLTLSLLDFSFMLRFILLLIGFSLALSHLITLPQLKSFDGISWKRVLIWFVIPDFMLRMMNYGMEPLVAFSHPILRFSSYFLIPFLGFLFFRYYFHYSIEVASSEKGDRRMNINHGIFILLLFTMMYLFLNPNVLMINIVLPYISVINISIIMTAVSLVICSFIDEGETYIVVPSALIFLLSTVLYPWNQVTIYIWPLSTIAFILLGSYLMESRPMIRISSISFPLIGYLLLVFSAFIMLVYEKYIIFQLISLLVIIGVALSLRKSFKGQMLNTRLFMNILIVYLIMLQFYYPSGSTVAGREQFRVLTFNLHYGTDSAGHDNIERIIEYAKEVSPTIIGFQEVSAASPLNGFHNMYAQLINGLKQLGYLYYAISTGGQFALRNMIFSKYRIIDSFTVLLEPVLRYKRTAIITTISIQEIQMQFASVHLTHVGPSKGTSERLQQVTMLLDILRDENVILVGDFNSEPTSPEQLLIKSTFNDSWGADPGFTSPARNPVKRIDYIYMRNINATSCAVTNTLISDHLPVFCDFTF